jgi:hypothetical protein
MLINSFHLQSKNRTCTTNQSTGLGKDPASYFRRSVREKIMKKDIIAAHRYSSNHRESVLASDVWMGTKGTLMKIITLHPLVIVVEGFYASASEIRRTWDTSPCDGTRN